MSLILQFTMSPCIALAQLNCANKKAQIMLVFYSHLNHFGVPSRTATLLAVIGDTQGLRPSSYMAKLLYDQAALTLICFRPKLL
jgi:hypothetical protein